MQTMAEKLKATTESRLDKFRRMFLCYIDIKSQGGNKRVYALAYNRQTIPDVFRDLELMSHALKFDFKNTIPLVDRELFTLEFVINLYKNNNINNKIFQYIPIDLRSNVEFMIEIFNITDDINIFEHIPDNAYEEFNNVKLLYNATSRISIYMSRSILRNLPEKLRNDEAYMLKCISEFPFTYKYIGRKLKYNFKILICALTRDNTLFERGLPFYIGNDNHMLEHLCAQPYQSLGGKLFVPEQTFYYEFVDFLSVYKDRKSDREFVKCNERCNEMYKRFYSDISFFNESAIFQLLVKISHRTKEGYFYKLLLHNKHHYKRLQLHILDYVGKYNMEDLTITELCMTAQDINIPLVLKFKL
jgi:hypothetical protein